MSSIGDWIGDTIFNAGRAVLDKARAFGRKLTPVEQKDQLEEWNRNHMPALMTGVCVVCGLANSKDTEHCPGPMRRAHKR